MKQILDFLTLLSENNNREWFHAHKQEYVDCKARFDALIVEMIAELQKFDPSIGSLTPSDCTWRIYRDTRFSADKRPYKTHFGAFLAPGGKKSGFSGYYFHIAPPGEGWEGGCFLGAGNYYADKDLMAVIREDMILDNGEAFAKAITAAEGFELDFDGALKKVPRGMPADQSYSDWLRLRNYCLCKYVEPEYMTSPGLKDRLVADFRNTKPFLDLINRSIAYVREQNQD